MARARAWRAVWLLCALCLLILAGVLAGVGTDRGEDVAVVIFPRDMPQPAQNQAPNQAPIVAKDDDHGRPANDGGPTAPAALPTGPLPLIVDGRDDPVERALGLGDRGVMIIDYSKLRHSELVDRMLRCRGGKAIAGLDQLRDETGIDLDRDVDRVGFSDEVVVVRGRLGGVDFSRWSDARVPIAADLVGWRMGDASDGLVVARVEEHLLLMGHDIDELRAAWMRIQGQAPVPEPLPPRPVGVGLFARFPGDWVTRFMGGGGGEDGGEDGGGEGSLDRALAMALEQGQLQLSVDDAVAASIDLKTKTPAQAIDLAKAIGAALSVARFEAARRDEHQIARLLDQARVLAAGDGRFGLDVALPGELLLDMMGCDADGTPREGDEAGGGDDEGDEGDEGDGERERMGERESEGEGATEVEVEIEADPGSGAGAPGESGPEPAPEP